MNKLTQRKDFQFFLKLLGVSFMLFLLYFAFIARPAVSFINGQILLPDYAHDDTLEVFNAHALNVIFNDKTLPAPATDQEINDLIHHYAEPISGHSCKWELCPYKGIKHWQFKDAVLDYTGEPEDSEPVQIDLLHLLTPDASYDELVEMVEED